MMRRTLCILLLTVAASLSSCNNSDDVSSDNSLISGTWRVLEVKITDQAQTQRSPNEEIITIRFNEGESFTGSTSVNSFNGRYQTNQSTLSMLEFSTTEVADTSFAGAFYNAISAAIVSGSTQASFQFRLDSEDLILVFGAQGEMRLQRMIQ